VLLKASFNAVISQGGTYAKGKSFRKCIHFLLCFLVSRTVICQTCLQTFDNRVQLTLNYDLRAPCVSVAVKLFIWLVAAVVLITIPILYLVVSQLHGSYKSFLQYLFKTQICRSVTIPKSTDQANKCIVVV
jgi:hypothetical protein